MPMLLPDNTVTGVYSKDVFKHYKQIAMIAQSEDNDYRYIKDTLRGNNSLMQAAMELILDVQANNFRFIGDIDPLNPEAIY